MYYSIIKEKNILINGRSFSNYTIIYEEKHNIFLFIINYWLFIFSLN